MRHSNLKYLLLFLLPAACDAQATPDYQGEPLLTLTGTLESQSTDPLPAADLVLAWADFTKTAEGTTWGTTFAQVQVASQLPAHFTAAIFQPPAESAYVPPDAVIAGYTLTGPRFAWGTFLLAKHGVTVTDTSINHVNPDENQVLANFDTYVLRYYESDGYTGVSALDGTVVETGPFVKKGFHLSRNDTTACASGPDQDCLDLHKMLFGVLTDLDRDACSSVTTSVTETEVPLDAPIDLVIPGPAPHASTLPPCPASQD